MAKGGMAGEMQAANRNALTAKGFELEARRMAGSDEGQVQHRLH